MSVIYKAVNKENGKAYIGFAVDFERRKASHLLRSKRGGGEYFHNALKKYGKENFDWIILKEDATLEDEIFFIEQHQTYWTTGRGYNLTKGGEGKLGYITPEETKQKISKKNKEHIPTEKQLEILRSNNEKMKKDGHSKETREKMIMLAEERKKNRTSEQIQEHKARVKKSWEKRDRDMFHTEEYKEKMRNSLSGRTRTTEQKEQIRLGALKRWEKQRMIRGF